MVKIRLRLLAIFTFMIITLLPAIASVPLLAQTGQPPLPLPPAQLKSHFMVGVVNEPRYLSWMTSTGVSWDLRYQYLTGGANKSSNWTSWGNPPGQFALSYMNDSYNAGYLPVFIYYQVYVSSPGNGSGEPEMYYNNLNNPATMYSIYDDFKLLMLKAGQFGKTVLINVEPDLWAFMQNRSINPNLTGAAVNSSGHPDVAGLPDSLAGFAKAIEVLRNRYAPNVLLGFHASSWGSPNYFDVIYSQDPNAKVVEAAQETGNFFLQTGANFDLLFYGAGDMDSALYESLGIKNRTWDTNNVKFPNFNRFNLFAETLTRTTGRRGIVWQVPLGNSIYRTVNNTNNHWQDNRVQYYFGSDNNQNITALVNSGIIAIMFGPGDGRATHPFDTANDGITNPTPINGNNLVSAFADDDGGYLRLRAKAYYDRGTVALNPVKFSSTPTPNSSLSQVSPVGTPTSTNLQIANSGQPISLLKVSAPVLSGAGAAAFKISPTSGFDVSAGAPKTINIQCTPASRTNYLATLTYSTNDPTSPTVSYNLSCKGTGPVFSAQPTANSSIVLTAQTGNNATAKISVSNTGDSGTNLAISAANLSGPNANLFTISPNSSFNLSAGAQASLITIGCTPPAAATYTATLSYTTNASGQPTVTYPLVCKGVSPVFGSFPARDSNIELFNRPNKEVSTTLSIFNNGPAVTNLLVGAPILSGPDANSFSILPAIGFSVAADSTQSITISCTTPTAGNTALATLTVPIQNDPNLASASYNLACKSLEPLVVVKAVDDGSGTVVGSLSNAINSYTAGQIIVFALEDNATSIIVSSQLPPLKAGTIIDGGNCNGGRPAITLAGAGSPEGTTGLLVTAGNSVFLRNLRVAGFSANQLRVQNGQLQANRCLVFTAAMG